MEAALGFMAAQLSELVGAEAAAGVKKGRAGDCGGIGIPATSPVIPGGRCAEPGRKGRKER